MKLCKKIVCYSLAIVFLVISCKEKKQQNSDTIKLEDQLVLDNGMRFISDTVHKKIDVYIAGEFFTSYIYDGQTPKPILFPIRTKSGKTVTRGFPFDPRPHERVDHPHHVGLWFNYGDVNGLDFWNNSYAISEEEKHKYGTIYHQEILNIDQKKGAFSIKALWRSPNKVDLLEETTQFIFHQEESTRSIDRITTLKALEEVVFKDNKEGMLGVRVARELEMPSDQPAVYTDSEGNVTEVKALNNTGVNGNYFSSEGLTGAEVWGTRNKWVKLEGTMNNETVSITMLDHQNNVGYPTYWHARAYGLFAANPLGQAVFSEGKTTLNYKLNKGESVIFKYRILIHNGSVLSNETIQQTFLDFNE